MQRIFLSIILFCIGLLSPAAAQQVFAVQGLLNTPWQSMQMWGGGLNAHQNWVLNTGVHFVAPDGGGVYLWTTNVSQCTPGTTGGCWYQILTDVSLGSTANCDSPGFATTGSCWGVVPTTGTNQKLQFWAGAVDICGSPVSSITAFVYWGGYIFKSTNVDPNNPQKLTWANVNQSPINSNWVKTTDTSNTTNRVDGPFMACDPASANHLYVATPGASAVTPAVFETKDGGATFSAISSSDIPTAPFTASGMVYVLAFDSGSGTTGGLTNTICVFTNGAPAGIYCSVSAGATTTWGRIGTGGPTTVDHMEFNSGTHALWVVDHAGALWDCVVTSLGSCTWATAAPSGLAWVAVDPITPANMVALNNSGQIFTSINSGGGWSSLFAYTSANGDTPWLPSYSPTPSGFNVAFDPVNDGNLAGNLGQGTWVTTFPSGNFVWTAQSKGIMHPPGSPIVATSFAHAAGGFQDIGVCVFNLTALPPGPCSALTQLSGLKYSSGFAQSVTDPNYSITKCSPDFSGNWDCSGWSSDGFKTTFHPWNRWEALVSSSNATITQSLSTTNVRVVLAGSGQTTGALTNWVNGQGTTICSFLESRIAGVVNVLTGNPSNIITTCYPAQLNVDGSFDLLGATYSSALTNITDPITGMTASYLFYDPTNPGSNLSGARNITAVQDDGSGHIEVCMINVGGAFGLGAQIDISGVVDSINGVNSIANGRWKIAAPPSGTLLGTRCMTLANSSSTGLGTYLSGGTGKTYIEPGGSLATTGNYVAIMPGNSGVPVCSNDRGTSRAGWSDIVVPGIPAAITTLTNGPYAAGSSRVTVANGNVVAAGAVIQIPMDDGRVLYTIPEGNLTITAGTYNSTTGATTLTASIETAGLTGDPIFLSGAVPAGLKSATYTGVISGTTLTASAVTNTINVGDAVINAASSGVPVADGTVITGLGSGTGGAGTYTINNSQNVSSEAMTSAFVTTSISGGGTSFAFTGPTGLGSLTINSGTLAVAGNVIPFARIAAAVPASTHYTVPPGRSLANGANVFNIDHGWITSDTSNNHTITADYVTPGKFSMINYLYGVVEWIGCGTPILVNNTTHPNGWQLSGGFGSTWFAIPGEEGHRFYTAGIPNSNGRGIAGNQLFRTCNGLTTTPNTGLLMHPVPGTFAAGAIGFGKAAGGKTYPTIIAEMWYDQTGTNTESSGTYGIYVSTDDPNHGNTGTNAVCKDSSAQFTGTITGKTLTFPSVVGTVSIGDGILAPIGGDVMPGTKIVSGSGLSWQVNISQNVGPEAMTAGGTFQKVGDFPSAFAGGPKWGSLKTAVTGDLTVPGIIELQTIEGPFYGVFNYLLKRDLNPAANDNSPVGLAMVG